jgi:type II secretory pathway component PulF
LVDFNDEPLPELDAVTAKQMLGQLLELQAAESPLPGGLRAAAASSSSSRTARAFRMLADRLEQGASSENILDLWASRVPPHVLGLLAAARRSGQDSQALLQFLEQEQQRDDMRRRVWRAMAYPSVLLLFALVLFFTAQQLIARQMSQFIEEFDVLLPAGLAWSLWWGEFGTWLILGMAVVLPAAALTCRATLPAEWWQILVSSTPVIGVLHWWAGTVQFLRILAMLLRQDVPMPEALQLVQSALADASLRQTCQSLRDQVLSGRTLSDSLESVAGFPRLVAVYLRGGELHKDLPAACDSAADLFETRITIRLEFLRYVVPAVVFLAILFLVSFTAKLAITPLITLISGLS